MSRPTGFRSKHPTSTTFCLHSTVLRSSLDNYADPATVRATALSGRLAVNGIRLECGSPLPATLAYIAPCCRGGSMLDLSGLINTPTCSVTVMPRRRQRTGNVLSTAHPCTARWRLGALHSTLNPCRAGLLLAPSNHAKPRQSCRLHRGGRWAPDGPSRSCRRHVLRSLPAEQHQHSTSACRPCAG